MVVGTVLFALLTGSFTLAYLIVLRETLVEEFNKLDKEEWRQNVWLRGTYNSSIRINRKKCFWKLPSESRTRYNIGWGRGRIKLPLLI